VQSRLTLERRILRCFCSEEIPAPVLGELTAKLIRYAWKDQDNRVVFDCLKRLTSAKNIMLSQLREQLPAQATRMGFPDVKWGNYIGQEKVDQETTDQPDIRNLVEQLLAAS
jgi:hypothetical protein